MTAASTGKRLHSILMIKIIQIVARSSTSTFTVFKKDIGLERKTLEWKLDIRILDQTGAASASCSTEANLAIGQKYKCERGMLMS